MDIFDLINMKKDMLINENSFIDELYETIETSPEEEYISTICENFDLALENANLQLFQYGSEEYIYDILEENEYWDITEEGVVSAIGEGIKKIIQGILNLIKKIFSFIGNLVNKAMSIFDRGKSEMDKVDKTIKEYNDAVKKYIIRDEDKKLINKNPYEATIEEDEKIEKIYKHNRNAKFNLDMGPQSIDSLYNTFGKEISIKSYIYKIGDISFNDEYRLTENFNNTMKDLDLILDSDNEGLSDYEKHYHKHMGSGMTKSFLNTYGVSSINDLPDAIKKLVRKEFIVNYKDKESNTILISKIPLTTIKKYAYNGEYFRDAVKAYKYETDNFMKKAYKRIDNMQIVIERKTKDRDQIIKKECNLYLNLIRALVNCLGIEMKEKVKWTLYGVNTSITIIKKLTKKLYKVQNNNDK